MENLEEKLAELRRSLNLLVRLTDRYKAVEERRHVLRMRGQDVLQKIATETLTFDELTSLIKDLHTIRARLKAIDRYHEKVQHVNEQVANLLQSLGVRQIKVASAGGRIISCWLDQTGGSPTIVCKVA